MPSRCDEVVHESTLAPISDRMTVTSRSRFMRSSASMNTSTLNDVPLDGAPSHDTSMMRSGWFIRSWAFGQSARCTDTPRPRVTNPRMSSPGTGLQQRERRTSTSSMPFTTTPLDVCASCFLGRFTLVSMGGSTPVDISDAPRPGSSSASVPRSTRIFSRRLATCWALSLFVPMFTSMSSGSL